MTQRDAFFRRWGIAYTFKLTEGNTELINEREFCVPWDAFVECAAAHGFDLVLSASFQEMVARYALENPHVYDEFFRDKHNSGDFAKNGDGKNGEFYSKQLAQMTEAEKELFELYRVFAFRKRG